MAETKLDYDLGGDDWDDTNTCDACGQDFDNGETGCPFCCNNGGAYAAGTEECDFCKYSDECARDYMRRMSPKRAKHDKS